MPEKEDQIQVSETKENAADNSEEKPNPDIKPPEYVAVPFSSIMESVEEIKTININLNPDEKEEH